MEGMLRYLFAFLMHIARYSSIITLSPASDYACRMTIDMIRPSIFVTRMWSLTTGGVLVSINPAAQVDANVRTQRRVLETQLNATCLPVGSIHPHHDAPHKALETPFIVTMRVPRCSPSSCLNSHVQYVIYK